MQHVVRVLDRNEDIAQRVVATAAGAQAGNPPVVDDFGVLGRHVAHENRALPAAVGDPACGRDQTGVMDATGKWPAPADPVSAIDRHRLADRSIRGHDEGVFTVKPWPCDGLGQVARRPAHAAAVAHHPADGAVQSGGCLDDSHEVGWRELPAPQGVWRPEPQQPGLGDSLEHRARESSLAIHGFALGRNQRGQRGNALLQARNGVLRVVGHSRFPCEGCRQT